MHDQAIINDSTGWAIFIAALIAAPGTVIAFVFCLYANGWL